MHKEIGNDLSVRLSMDSNKSSSSSMSSLSMSCNCPLNSSVLKIIVPSMSQNSSKTVYGFFCEYTAKSGESVWDLNLLESCEHLGSERKRRSLRILWKFVTQIAERECADSTLDSVESEWFLNCDGRRAWVRLYGRREAGLFNLIN